MESEYGTHTIASDGPNSTEHAFWPSGRENYPPAQHPRCMICGEDSRADSTLEYLPVCSDCRSHEHRHHKWDPGRKRWYLPEWKDRPKYYLAYFRRGTETPREEYIERGEFEGQWKLEASGFPLIPTGEWGQLWKWKPERLPEYRIMVDGVTVGASVFIRPEEF